eukprot:s319_g21.t1
MVRNLRSREASTAPPVPDTVDTVDTVNAKDTVDTAPVETATTESRAVPPEVKPEEPTQGEEVLVGHTQMDLVALGQRADKEQRAAEEEKLPCLSRCRVRLAHCCRNCCESLAACFRRRLDAWETWLAAREQASLRSSFEQELRRLYADQLPAPGLLDLWGPSVRTMEKCHTLSFSEKEVLLAFTEAQLKRSGPNLLKAPRQMLPRLLGQLAAVLLVSIGLFCLLATIALAPTRSLTFNAGTIVDDARAVAGATSVSTQALWDFPNLTLDQLRQVEDVFFEEKQRAHVLKIAATSKLPDGSVILQSADSTVRVTPEGAAYWSQGSAEVFLSDMEALRSLPGPASVGGLFSAVRYQ